jgi:hypothetical protein
LKHLHRPYPDQVREGIVRALAVREAKFAWNELTSLYEAEPEETKAKRGMAVALAAISHKAVLDDVIALAQDRRHGASRLHFLRALRRSRDPRARQAFEDLGSDPQLAVEVKRLLKRQK